MTTPPLPPEIKSAEEAAHKLDNWIDDNPNGFCREQYICATIRQRDLAIWNAAIERAAETCRETPAATMGQRLGMEVCEQAILNLKRKE